MRFAKPPLGQTEDQSGSLKRHDAEEPTKHRSEAQTNPGVSCALIGFWHGHRLTLPPDSSVSPLAHTLGVSVTFRTRPDLAARQFHYLPYQENDPPSLRASHLDTSVQIVLTAPGSREAPSAHASLVQDLFTTKPIFVERIYTYCELKV